MCEVKKVIAEKAKLKADDDPDDQLIEEPGRRRGGYKRSKKQHNAEGETEGSLKRQSKKDKAQYRKYKKRHRKDLSPEEIEAIVTAAKVPHRLHKDIAQEFKIPALLVGKLVKESNQEPEKLEAYRTRLQLKL